MTIHPDTRIQRNPGILAAEVGAELVMFSGDQGRYFGLNDVGAAIWERLEQPTTAGRLCAELRLLFAVEPDRCLEEVCAYLSEMLTKGLVNLAPCGD